MTLIEDKRLFFAKLRYNVVIDDAVLLLSVEELKGYLQDIFVQGAQYLRQYGNKNQIVIKREVLYSAQKKGENDKLQLLMGYIKAVQVQYSHSCRVVYASKIKEQPFILLSNDLSCSPLYNDAIETYTVQKGNQYWNIKRPKFGSVTIQVDEDVSLNYTLKATLNNMSFQVDTEKDTFVVRKVPTGSIGDLTYSIVSINGHEVSVQNTQRSSSNVLYSLFEQDQDQWVLIPSCSFHTESAVAKGSILSENQKLLSDLANQLSPSCQSSTRLYTLDTEINQGGEGKIVTIQNQPKFLCKIYTKSITERLKKKLERLSQFTHKHVSFPKEIVSYNNKFAGYVMPKFSGVGIDTFLNLRDLRKKYPNIRRLDLVNIALQWVKIVEFIHKSGIYIVDLNPQNVLVDPKTRVVSIVDIDSAQIDKYPCEVGVEDYLSPRQIDAMQNNGQLAMSIYKDELFSIGIMLFKILMGNKHPLECKQLSDDQPKNKQRQFVYTFKNYGDASRMPGGTFPVLWERMNDGVKQLFHDIFTHDKEVPLSKIKQVLQDYQQYIVKHQLKHPALNSLNKT